MSESGGEEKPEIIEIKDDKDPGIESDLVVTKYNMAADIVNEVLKEVLAKCQPGALIIDVCDFGDQQLTERTAKVFKKEKEMKKGIAFPTCVSVNNCVCHFSPLKSEVADLKFQEGDVVKIDLGAHIDGYCAMAAHTTVVGASKENKATGRKADVILAAHYCLEAAIRMLRPADKHKNADVTELMTKIADIFQCRPVENMLSFQLKRNNIGSEEEEEAKVIILNPSEDQRAKVKRVEFLEHEVYAIDILISSGEGKAREQDARTTVFKRNEAITYNLKLKASRNFFFEADKRFGNMPFTIRAFEDERSAKIGSGEAEKHNLMKAFKVYYDRPGSFVAQFKSTVLIMPNGLLKITGLPFDIDVYESEHKIQDANLLALLQSSLKPSKKKPKSGDKKKGTDEKEKKPPVAADEKEKKPPAAANDKAKKPPAAANEKAKKPPVAANEKEKKPPAAADEKEKKPPVAANSPATNSPAAKSPEAKSPASKSPAVKSPAAKSPAANSPAANGPATKEKGKENQPIATEKKID